MAISYHVYANDGRGGDVDYSSPVATTSGLTLAVGSLAAPSDNTYAVRAFDAASGIEEANTDARVRVVIDPAGNDVSARPNPVHGLSARRAAGGTYRASWSYDVAGQGGAPSFFDVTITPGPSSPVETVDFLPGVTGYGCSIPVPAAPGVYAIEVRAVGASVLLASEPAVASIEHRPSPLGGVDALVAVPTP